MLNLRLLASQTRIHKFSNFPLHSRPPKQLFQIMIHLSRTRMNTQPTTVSFFQNTPSEFINIRNTSSVTKLQYTILVDSEFATLALINQSQLINQSNISLLTFSDFFKNTTSQLQHTQFDTSRSTFTH